MDTLEAFFPFRDFLGPLKLAVTPWFVSLILFGFVACSARLYLRLAALRQRVMEFSGNTTDQPHEGKDFLHKAWSDYQQTFFLSEDGLKKTISDAEEYFGTKTLLGKQVNLRFWTALPGLFLGLGILGTFLGLTLGIEGFDSSDSDTIQKSIDGLLGGMSTAFLTSLYGMTVSLLFNFFEKEQFKRTSDAIHDLCLTLNKEYRLSQADALRSEDSRRWRVLKAMLVDGTDDGEVLPSHVLRDLLGNANEQTKALKSFPTDLGDAVWQLLRLLLVDKDDGTDILPSHVLRDLLGNANEQTRALKSFSTDLADGIMISTQTIEMMGDQVGKSIGTNLENAIIPAIVSLTDAVEELRNEKQESSGEFIARIVDDLGETVTEALEQVNTTFTANTVKQMEDLASAVSAAGASFSTVPALIEESMQNVRDGMEARTHAFLEASKTAIEHLGGIVEQYTATAEKTETMFLAFNQTIANLEDASGKVGAGVTTLSAHMKVLQDSSAALERVTSSLEEHVDEFGEKQRDSLDAFGQSLRQAEQMVRTNAEHIKEIEAGLASVFGQIQDGLTSYRDTTKESINEYLSTLARESSTSIRSLAGCLEELRDTLEDFDFSQSNGRDSQ